MDIRLADVSEKQELEDFLVFNGGEEWRDLARNYVSCMFSQDYRRPTFMIACNNNSIIGSAAFSEEIFTVNVWGISWVNVHPEWRRQGIAGKLVQACTQEIKKRAGKKVTVILGTYPNQTGLYDRTGFKAIGQDHEGGSFMVQYVGGAE